MTSIKKALMRLSKHANNNRESSHAIIYLNGKQICEGYGTNSSSTDRSVVSLKKGDKLTSRAGNYLYGPVVCGISWTSIDVGGVLQRLINFCTLSWKGGVA